MRKQILAMLMAALCVFAPVVAFAVEGNEQPYTVGLAPNASTSTLTVTYPYADADNNGENDYALEVGQLTKNFCYSYLSAASSDSSTNDVTSETFDVTQGESYFYRVSNPLDTDAVTYGNYITASSETNTVTVSAADMRVGDHKLDKGTVVDDFSLNKYDTGDLYLNTGSTGHVQLQIGEEYSLYPFRNWMPIASSTQAKPLEPDFHVEVIDLDGTSAITATEQTSSDSGKHKWVLTAKNRGTALVKVTYDAMTYAGAMAGLTDFSAIWPENTGLFVVTVGQVSNVEANFTLNVERNNALAQENGQSTGSSSSTSPSPQYGANAKVAGNALDAEFDVLYYVGDGGASYTFSPELGVSVSVARGVVENGALEVGAFEQEGVSTSSDGAVTVSGLMTGKHIIKVEKDGNVAYQVIRARKADCAIYAGEDVTDAGKLVYDSSIGILNAYTDGTTPITAAAYKALNDVSQGLYTPLVKAGSTVTFVIDGLQHPANKMPNCYNMTAGIVLEGGDGTAFSQTIKPYGSDGQYTFASAASCHQLKCVLPDTVPSGTYVLEGALQVVGYGYGGYGSHRQVTYEEGSLNSGLAALYSAYFGRIPAMSLYVVGEEGSGSDPGSDSTEAQQAADAFAALVAAIGDVDLDAVDRIAAARAAYDALSPEALALVDAGTLATLQAAEEALAALQAATFQPVDIAEGCVRVVIENATYSTDEGAPWDGVLVDKQVEINSLTDTMRTLVDKALEQSGMLPCVGNEGYVSSIEGIAEKAVGDASGWMAMLNGWFVNRGLNEFAAKDGAVTSGDEIRVVYSSDGGPDVGSDFSLEVKELKRLAICGATLSPSFTSDTHDYVLNVPEGASCVWVKAVPENCNWQARTYLGEVDAANLGYRFNDAIPVCDGDEIVVAVGDPTWPSMNSSEKPAQLYRLKVNIASSSSGSSDLPNEKTKFETPPVVPTSITLNTAKVTKKKVAKACAQAGANLKDVRTIVLGPKVKRIAARAFAACKKATVLEVQTKKLKKKRVYNSLSKSKVKTVRVNIGSAKVNKKFVKKYKKIFAKKVSGKKVKTRVA